MTRGRHGLLWGVVGAGLLLAGCPDDPDANCDQALVLPPNLVVEDSLDVRAGDAGDCKQVRYIKNATALIRLEMGTHFTPHTVHGRVRLYNARATLLQEVAIQPGTVEYNITHELQANEAVYVKLEAEKGEGNYRLELTLREIDPCARCNPETEICRNGQCFPKPKVCDPVCNPDLYFCNTTIGQCEAWCNPMCGLGQRCNHQTRRCETVTRGCQPPCAANETCNPSTLRCERPETGCDPACAPGEVCRNRRCVRPTPRGCDPPCAPGKICRGRRCVDPPRACDGCTESEDCNTRTGQCEPKAMSATVTNLTRNGARAWVYLNRGSAHGVRVGWSGKLCERWSFRVDKVTSSHRSRAQAQASIEEIGDCRSARLQPH